MHPKICPVRWNIFIGCTGAGQIYFFFWVDTKNILNKHHLGAQTVAFEHMYSGLQSFTYFFFKPDS